MAVIHPFRALRPKPTEAPRVASVPYDVVNTEEARVLAADNSRSFLRVSRARLRAPANTRPLANRGLGPAFSKFRPAPGGAFVLQNPPGPFPFPIGKGRPREPWLAACFSLDEYDRDVIKKH